MNNLRVFDHLVLCADKLEKARGFYKKAGFTMTPVAVHPFGTHNSIVQLQGNFLEILSVNAPSLIVEPGLRKFSFAAFNRDFLNAQEGLSMVVFQGDDARGDAAEFSARGLSDFEPFDFSRKARLPDGGEVTVSFSLAFVAHEDMPGAAFFTCHQHAPEYFWKPEYQSHENSARAIIETMMVADQPVQYTDFFNKLLNSTGSLNDQGVLGFAIGDGRFTLLTPEQWHRRFEGESRPNLTQGPRMAGFTIAVDRLDETTRCLTANNITFAKSQAGVFISAKTAHGCVIEFAEHT